MAAGALPMIDDLVICIPSFRGGGAEGAMVRLANAMASRGIKTTVLVLESTGPWREVVDASVEIVDLGTKRVSRSFAPLVRFFRNTRVRIFISNLTHLNLMIAMAHWVSRSTAKLLLVEHNHLISRAIWDNEASNRLSPLGIRWLYRRAARVLTVSEGVRRSMVEHFNLPPDQVVVLHNPVDLELIERGIQANVHHPWVQDPELRVILGVGRLVYLKGWDILLEALPLIRRRHNARIVLLGEGETLEALQKQAVDLGLESFVEILGFQSNPYAWMASSDVFVLPSRSEGFGIVLVEAMASGVPVVASDCRSGPAEILGDGSFGRLVPVGDVQALADNISDLLSQTEVADTLKHKARIRAQDFAVERIADRLLSILAEVE